MSRIEPRVVMAAALLLSAGCRQDMHDQPSYQPLEASAFFEDGRSARTPVPGTVARGQLRDDEHLETGKIDGRFAATFPYPVTGDVMARGHERYDIFCSPCHDRLGNGRGMVVRRGFPAAASFHIDRLRAAEPGYIFDVITNGFGRMAGHASQIPVRDRWAIVAYVRALQLSQDVREGDLSRDDRDRLRRSEPAR